MSGKTPKRITVIRATHDAENMYFMMSRETAQDDGLSFDALGVMAYVLSKPRDWDIKPKDLQRRCGRDKVYKLLNELIDHRYMVRFMEANNKGQYTKVVYELHERPLPENPEAENPDTVSPYTENTDTNIIESLQITDSTGKEKLPVAPPKSPKTERPRNLLFDAIALNIFEIDPAMADEIEEQGGRIGKAMSAIVKAHRAIHKDQSKPTPEDLSVFIERWNTHKDTKGLSIPRDGRKLAERWLKFMSKPVKGSGPEVVPLRVIE